MHTGIENEILATLRIIAAQNNELIGLIRGYIDQRDLEKTQEAQNANELYSELFKGLCETGAIDALAKKIEQWKARGEG